MCDFPSVSPQCTTSGTAMCHQAIMKIIIPDYRDIIVITDYRDIIVITDYRDIIVITDYRDIIVITDYRRLRRSHL